MIALSGESSTRVGVFVLHGLAANRLMTHRLVVRLRRRGYDVLNWGYHSYRTTIPEIATRFSSVIESERERRGWEQFHIVGHSMGCIITRELLLRGPVFGLDRVVMLAPPNGGSAVARALATWLGWLCWPLEQLSSDAASYVNRLPREVPREFGVIAAEGDLVVPLASTFLPGAKDHIVLPGRHGLLPSRSDTAIEVDHFLRHGRFSSAARRTGSFVEVDSSRKAGALELPADSR